MTDSFDSQSGAKLKPTNSYSAVGNISPAQRVSRAAQLRTCPLCRRNVDLTFHHLIPKKMHRRRYFRKTYTRKQMAEGIYLCRLCHTGVHDLFDEMSLAKQFNTPALLQANALLAKHCEWVSRQRTGLKR